MVVLSGSYKMVETIEMLFFVSFLVCCFGRAPSLR